MCCEWKSEGMNHDFLARAVQKRKEKEEIEGEERRCFSRNRPFCHDILDPICRAEKTTENRHVKMFGSFRGKNHTIIVSHGCTAHKPIMDPFPRRCQSLNIIRLETETYFFVQTDFFSRTGKSVCWLYLFKIELSSADPNS